MTISSSSSFSLSWITRRLALGAIASVLLIACGSDDPDDGAAGSTGGGNLFQFTVEGPEISKRTATFRPTADQVDFILGGIWYQVGGSSKWPDPTTEEGERYGQVFFHPGKEYTSVGTHTNVQGVLQMAVYPTADSGGDKVIRDEDEDGLPGGLDIVVTKSSDTFIEGTFTGTLNCTNCTPAQSYALTAGSFRFSK